MPINLTLRFTKTQPWELSATLFTCADGARLETSRGQEAKRQIIWGKGLQSVALFLVQYVSWSKKSDPSEFGWRGERGSPAATLDGALGQTKPIGWLESMFGPYVTYGAGQHSLLFSWIKRLNPEKRRSSEPFGHQMRPTGLPPEAVHIWVDEQQITTADQLEQLAADLSGQWKGRQNLPPSQRATGHACGTSAPQPVTRSFMASELKSQMDYAARQDPASPPRSMSVAARCADAGSQQQPTVSKTEERRPDADHAEPATVPGSTPITPNQDQLPGPALADNTLDDRRSLTARIQSIPAASLRRRIVAALDPTQGEAAVTRAAAEILSPACVEVISEKLVADSIDTLLDFYEGDSDPMSAIKRSVASTIASSRSLRKRLARKVARSGWSELLDWFTVFHAWFSWQVFREVNTAIAEFATEASFREVYNPATAREEDIDCLISKCSDENCTNAASIFSNALFERIRIGNTG